MNLVASQSGKDWKKKMEENHVSFVKIFLFVFVFVFVFAFLFAQTSMWTGRNRYSIFLQRKTPFLQPFLITTYSTHLMFTLLTGHTESYEVAPTAAGTTARRRAFRSHGPARTAHRIAAGGGDSRKSIHFVGSRDEGGERVSKVGIERVWAGAWKQSLEWYPRTLRGR